MGLHLRRPNFCSGTDSGARNLKHARAEVECFDGARWPCAGKLGQLEPKVEGSLGTAGGLTAVNRVAVERFGADQATEAETVASSGGHPDGGEPA